MSDIDGPNIPNPNQPAIKATNRTQAQTRDHAHTDKRAGEHAAKPQANETEALKLRDPAVSIAATVAHIHIGDNLKQAIQGTDIEGRPIIVTERATYALRPDAGLKIGDDIRIIITEADKSIYGDLYQLNTHPIDPPVRLQLIVIAVHSPKDEQVKPLPMSLPQYTLPYSQFPQTNSENTILSNTYEYDQKKSDTVSAPLLPPQHRAVGKPSNPDPLLTRANSEDLHTLINAQSKAQHHTKKNSNPASHLQENKTALTSYNLMSPWITAQNADLERAEADMLGAKIKAKTSAISTPDVKQHFLNQQPFAMFSQNGDTLITRVIETSSQNALSHIPPNRVAIVHSTTPLMGAALRNLPISVSTFAASASGVASVATSKGDFYIPASLAASLQGKALEILPNNEIVVTEPANKSHAQTYAGQYLVGGSRSDIIITLPNPRIVEASTAGTASIIEKVTFIRSFLSHTGPATNMQITTNRGDIFVTLPTKARPTIGDPILIMPQASPSELVKPPLITVIHDAPVQAVQAAQVATAQAPLTFADSIPLAIVPELRGWPAMETALSVLSDVNPDAAASLAARSSAGGERLSSSLMFLLHAARGGGTDEWLGDAAKILDINHKNLLAVLKDDVSKLLAMAIDTGGEWRPMIVPLDTRDHDMPFIAFLLRSNTSDNPPQDKQTQNDDEDQGNQFVLEVHFSFLGPIQMLGTIKDQTFDLTLRSAKNLPAALIVDIQKIFSYTLAASAFKGQLKVLEGAVFPVNVSTVLGESVQRHSK